MGSIPLDNGESVYIHDGTGSADPVAISAAEGNSLADLMRRRERFDFTWANAAELDAQTGMVQGSRGYREDTKSEYLYDNSTWRLALPYAEYTATQTNVADGTFTGLGVFAIDSGQSTDSSMLVPQSSGIVRCVNPGIYSIQAHTLIRNSADDAWLPVTARSFLDISVPPGVPIPLHRASVNAGEDQISIAMPVLRITASNTDIEVRIFKTNGVGTTRCKTTVRIARLG
jgi:hypothetical protein